MPRHKWKSHRPLFTPPARNESPKVKWEFWPLLWAALKRTCMALGALMLISSVISVFIFHRLIQPSDPPSLPKKMVLTFALEEDLPESPHQDLLSAGFIHPMPTVQALTDALDRAAGDDRVKGFLVRMDEGHLTLSQTQDFRAAVKRFRESGKFAHIYSSSYGGMGSGLSRYCLASAFDEIWMQPMGVVFVGGINLQMPFFKGILDKLGVTPEFMQRKEYKSAYENFMRSSMSKASKESLGQVVTDLKDVFLETIPADIGMDVKNFETLVHKGLLTDKEALEAKLITHLDYVDVLVDRTKEELGEDIEFVNLDSYGRIRKYEEHKSVLPATLMKQNKPSVAVVYVNGAIVSTNMRASSSVFMPAQAAAADEITPALYEAQEDERIKAVVLRVNSPGGSPVAAEAILRAAAKVQEKGKLVIVSMGDMAASGGYWVSAYADYIFAMPTTLTGSIGVIGGKVSGAGLSKKLGVSWDSVQWGENSNMWSPAEPFSASGKERMNAMLDRTYEAFIERVAKGRKMSENQVDQIAKGRVWTGKQALAVGLVDELGNLNDALDKTAELLGKESRKDINIVMLPRAKTKLELLIEFLEMQGVAIQAGKMQGAVLNWLSPYLQSASIAAQPEVFSVYEPLSQNFSR